MGNFKLIFIERFMANGSLFMGPGRICCCERLTMNFSTFAS